MAVYFPEKSTFGRPFAKLWGPQDLSDLNCHFVTAVHNLVRTLLSAGPSVYSHSTEGKKRVAWMTHFCLLFSGASVSFLGCHNASEKGKKLASGDRVSGPVGVGVAGGSFCNLMWSSWIGHHDVLAHLGCSNKTAAAQRLMRVRSCHLCASASSVPG